jgi:predicted 3-demethylubiquinone-9 3-methyltransferase (glyoxalase superfamily)
MQKIKLCLLFDGRAEEATNFYAGIFRDARIIDVMRYGDAGPGPKGAILAMTFELNGQEIMALNGPQFPFTPAISLFVTCETQEEIDGYWDALSNGGKKIQCGWLTDKFGVTWQIVPRVLGEMLRDKDAAKSSRVMTAMMKMQKLDIAPLVAAYEGR